MPPPPPQRQSRAVPVRSCAAALDELEEEEAFVADYEETYSMAGYERPEQELSDEEDTRSVINEASKPQNVSIRQDVIAKLRTLAGKPAAVDQAPPCPDAMENMFQTSKALVSKPKQSGFAFSINQRATLDGIVNPGKRVFAKALSVTERKLLPVDEDDFNYVRTPSVNQTIKDMLVARKERKSSLKQRTFRGVLGPLNQKVESEAYKLDLGNRVGLKYAAYSQWLTTAIKSELLSQLGPDHSLTSEEGMVMKLCNEQFLAQNVQLSQFARNTVHSTMLRRDMYLNELNLKDYPKSLAMGLPLDPTNSFLFGTDKDEAGKVVSIDSLISDYAKLDERIEKVTPALKPTTAYTNQNVPPRTRGATRTRPYPQTWRPRPDLSYYDQSRYGWQAPAPRAPMAPRGGVPFPAAPRRPRPVWRATWGQAMTGV